jgi:DNA-binding SARP family transcriptional activator
VSRLQLYLLGAPRFEHDGHPVELTVAKAIALLGYLAVSATPPLRDRLLALLWPDSAPEAARKNLRNALWTIRKALGEDAVVSDDQQLALDAAVWTDVREISDFIPRGLSLVGSEISDRDESAIELYRGPFLDGLQLDDAPDFEIWLTGERERFAQLYLRALTALVAAYQAQGDWQNVIAAATRALNQDNLQEPMYRALMEAHARLGERAQALREYDTLRATLSRELGVEPLAETDALRRAILAGAYDQPSAPAHEPAPRRARVTPTVQAPRPFVGRDAERAALDAEWRAAAARHARVVLLSGELGIGKSRLWQEWSAALGPQVRVLETRCLESTQGLPLAPLTELFRSDALEHCLASPHSPLAPVWLTEVARLVPEIHSLVPNLPTASAELPPEEERRRLFEAFTQALLALGANPLALFLDDLHWADPTTLDWLDYFVHRLQDRPVLVVAALRPEDAPAPLARLQARWAREGLARRINLTRLTAEESIALAAALGVDPTIAQRVQLQSAGNPYFLIELIRALPSENVPPVLAELVRARVNRLPDGARQVLQAAAVLEPDFDFGTLRRTSGRGEEETLDALDALLSTGVLEERAEAYAFSHPLVCKVVRGELSGARRAFLHHRAAQALELTYAGRLAPVAGRIAEHYAQSMVYHSQNGDSGRAAYFAEMAAEHALRLAAPAEAVAFYRQALALEPTPAREFGLGQALLRQGDIAEVRTVLERAMRGFESSGDRPRAGRASLRIAETFFASARFAEGQAWIEKGLNYLDQANDVESHALAHLLLGSSGASAETEQHLRSAARHAQESDLFELGARSHFVLGNLLAERGDLAAALESYRAAVALAEKAGDEFQQALALNNLAYHSLLAGDLTAAHQYVEAGLALADQRALRIPLQNLYSTRGEIALAEHQWRDAEEWFERGLAEAERNANAREIANARANLGLTARGQGDLDAALVLLDSARESAARLTDQHLQIKIDLLLVELYLQRGERTAASEALRRAEAALQTSPRRLWQEWAARLR